MNRFLLATFCIFLCVTVTFAHPGKTDSNGGHYNCATGEYHYHHGYPAHQHANGICPYNYVDRAGLDDDAATSFDYTILIAFVPFSIFCGATLFGAVPFVDLYGKKRHLSELTPVNTVAAIVVSGSATVTAIFMAYILVSLYTMYLLLIIPNCTMWGLSAFLRFQECCSKYAVFLKIRKAVSILSVALILFPLSGNFFPKILCLLIMNAAVYAAVKMPAELHAKRKALHQLDANAYAQIK